MMQRLTTAAVLAVALAATCASAQVTLPQRARGGRAWRELQARMAPVDEEEAMGMRYREAADDAQTWQAQVDNFNASDERTYAQRFFVNRVYYDPETQPNAPLFLSIGGEGALSSPPTGYIEVLGKERGALLIALEHRFYGESLPGSTGNPDEDDQGELMSPANLQYLTVEQALADANAFLEYYKKNFLPDDGVNTPVFAFGGSYPGALACWFRDAYPDASVGSLSSSGVVEAIQHFPEFDNQVMTAIGEECSAVVRDTNAAFERKTAADGVDSVADMFGCPNPMNVPDMFYAIADSWSMMVQYGHMGALCDTMGGVEGEDDDVLMTTFRDLTFEIWGTGFCSDFYSTAALSHPATANQDELSWRWQKCYQLAYLQTAPAEGSLRSHVLTQAALHEQCTAVFGQEMIPSVHKINARYGGADPTATRVASSSFFQDPWSRACRTEQTRPDQPFDLIECNECGHCKDLHTPEEADPQELKDWRAEFEKYMDLWIEEAVQNMA